MGPALETFFTFLLLVALCIGAAAWLGRPLWRRLYRSLSAWYERDLREEREAALEAENRKRAEAELAACTHSDLPAAQAAKHTLPVDMPDTHKADDRHREEAVPVKASGVIPND